MRTWGLRSPHEATGRSIASLLPEGASCLRYMPSPWTSSPVSSGTPNAPIVIDLGPDTVRNTLPAVLRRSVATMPKWAGSIAGRSAIVICEDGGAASQGRYRSATPGGRECHRQRQAGSHQRSHRSLPGTCRGRRRAAARDRSVSSNLKILVTLGFSIKDPNGTAALHRRTWSLGKAQFLIDDFRGQRASDSLPDQASQSDAMSF